MSTEAEEKKYWAPETWWTRLANFTRHVAGITETLNHEEILTELAGVSFIPQGRAFSTISGLAFASTARDAMSTLYESSANSTISNLKFNSSAVGELSE